MESRYKHLPPVKSTLILLVHILRYWVANLGGRNNSENYPKTKSTQTPTIPLFLEPSFHRLGPTWQPLQLALPLSLILSRPRNTERERSRADRVLDASTRGDDVSTPSSHWVMPPSPPDRVAQLHTSLWSWRSRGRGPQPLHHPQPRCRS